MTRIGNIMYRYFDIIATCIVIIRIIVIVLILVDDITVTVIIYYRVVSSGTSVPSERLFSKVVLLLTPFVVSLTPDHVNTLTFCQGTCRKYSECSLCCFQIHYVAVRKLL